jgi:hypothetical protein
VVVCVGPDTDGSISGASSQNLLFNADIQAQDTLAVETGYQILELIYIAWSFKVDLHF